MFFSCIHLGSREETVPPYKFFRLDCPFVCLCVAVGGGGVASDSLKPVQQAGSLFGFCSWCVFGLDFGLLFLGSELSVWGTDGLQT